MPRLPTSLLLTARHHHPFLPLLLRTTRTLPSALAELRWLTQHVRSHAPAPLFNRTLRKLCISRARGTPLQYLLDTEFFGDLEIACTRGVLIPRQDTAAAVKFLAACWGRASGSGAVSARKDGEGEQGDAGELRVLDLCTGSGCASLLFRHEFLQSLSHAPSPPFKILGVDVDAKALKLARFNRQRLVPKAERGDIAFARADVLKEPDSHVAEGMPSLSQLLETRGQTRWDVLIANPPYVSLRAYWDGTTARSVRGFEPKRALVPPAGGGRGVHEGDTFYPALLRAADDVSAKAVLLEVGDLEQAVRVVKMVLGEWRGVWEGMEIWRDEPDWENVEQFEVCGELVNVRGVGNGRSVVCWRGMAGSEFVEA